MAAPLRGFRLRRPGSAQKFGAAAGSLRGLLRKGCRLLQVRAGVQGSGIAVPWVSVPCLESRFKNKSSYMRYSCESRIRSYMKEVSNFISNVHPTARDAYKRILDLMSDKLKSVKYNGSYFDRTEEEAAVRLCTKEGWFSCQGPFDRDDCPCKHSINPYTNRESRILFSTWNLDHIIEKKRSVVPELAEAVKTRDGREVNWEYFYQLLFTVNNLKLVHIACHKKTNHNLSCDKTKIYRKRKQSHEIS
ncbi:hypothetical protein CIB84_002827 [Bambusicola thoracicus]|uniref:DNA fragmentation factor 40 C-terminal domain-containing protein n=1 Tax=Bambusicola thoracicus TaxID=9083 RepID=A0A2P4TAM3_BAMTH|nr:hypothetical protein CIB84_002827 [Bambusicola thoracicus]